MNSLTKLEWYRVFFFAMIIEINNVGEKMQRTSVTKRLILILIGSFILAFGMYHFNYQNNITEGGVLGLLLFFKNVFAIEPGITNLLIDGSLFLLGMRFLGKRFIIDSLLATVSFSCFYSLFVFVGPMIPALSSKVMATLLAGIFVGVGVGLIVRTGAAAGGDDVIALLLQKHTRMKIGHVYLATDAFVLLLSSWYLAPYELFWSLIAVVISGRIINYFFYWNRPQELI